jgi:hypothetical protein
MASAGYKKGVKEVQARQNAQAAEAEVALRSVFSGAVASLALPSLSTVAGKHAKAKAKEAKAKLKAKHVEKKLSLKDSLYHIVMGVPVLGAPERMAAQQVITDQLDKVKQKVKILIGLSQVVGQFQ